MAHALYSVDPVTGEADGTVYHFCSQTCCEQFPCPANQALVYGQSDDYVTQSVCDNCSKPLPDEPITGWLGKATDTEGRMPQ